MEIKLMPRVEDIVEEDIEGSSAIVIDMLRATSVITTAIYNGAEKVIPVLTIEEALEYKKTHGDSVVLGGERKGLKIEGFDAANSPLEYTREFIGCKTLVMTTSNGTRAIKGCLNARNIYIGSMLNGSAAAKAASKGGEDVSIVCAGTLGRFSLDDFICAGYIIDELVKSGHYKLNDISFLAHHSYVEYKDNVQDFIKNAFHYKYLLSIGLEDDIKYCCKKGIIDIVPEYKNGEITM